MAQEIERKFLLASEAWREAVTESKQIRQGYLSASLACSVRVRVIGERAWLNIKSATVDISRDEYEYEIPVADGTRMLDTLARRPFIEKVRHLVPHGQHVFEIDEFSGDNAGLVVAEVELDDIDEQFEQPPWLGAEVSDDPRYLNAALVEHPYSRW